MMELDAATLKQVLRFQYLELTEALIYERLARRERNPANRKVLQQIANDEVRHYEFWKEYSGQEVAPSRLRVAWFSLLARLFGITFCVNLLERDEVNIAAEYRNILDIIPAARPIMEEEEAHEQHLLGMLDEERLLYTGSMVLGLNDALGELTGALAGLTFAFQNLRLVALAGLVTGIAAAMSMAASEFLATRTEGDARNPLRAAFYTGVAYLVTVFLLVMPYLALQPDAPDLLGLSVLHQALGATLLIGAGIVGAFNFYVSVAQNQPFRRRFIEMCAISGGVALLSYGVAIMLRGYFDISP
jgi:VIT1/CCC1 family predicted Fe2+/Mn2+ transporter